MIAAVTGGSRGIGAATAVALATAGWDVAIGYREAADRAAEVVASCERVGSRAVSIRMDVAAEADIVRFFDSIDGPIGALVNNAGIVAPGQRVEEMSAARVSRMMQVNVVGAFVCAREAVRRMSTRSGGAGGVIVNVSSAAARNQSPNEYVDYAASKAAIDSMTVGLAREVAGDGIRVNAVRPGIIDTEIHASGGRPDRLAELAPLIPMGRGGTAEEVAAAIAWLCSDAASYVTGAVLDVTGGR